MDTQSTPPTTAAEQAIAKLLAASAPPPTGCIVCRDPTGVRCCEFGAAR